MAARHGRKQENVPDSMIHEDFPFFPTQKEHAAHAQVSRDQRKAERHRLRLSPASEPGGPRLPANPWGRPQPWAGGRAASDDLEARHSCPRGRQRLGPWQCQSLKALDAGRVLDSLLTRGRAYRKAPQETAFS